MRRDLRRYKNSIKRNSPEERTKWPTSVIRDYVLPAFEVEKQPLSSTVLTKTGIRMTAVGAQLSTTRHTLPAIKLPQHDQKTIYNTQIRSFTTSPSHHRHSNEQWIFIHLLPGRENSLSKHDNKSCGRFNKSSARFIKLRTMSARRLRNWEEAGGGCFSVSEASDAVSRVHDDLARQPYFCLES